MENERIILGSGYVHIGEIEKGAPVPDPVKFCTEENLYSYIQGGATLEYKPSFYEAKDDMGKVSKVRLTEEEATMKSGLMTFCGKTMKALCQTARIEEVVEAGKKYRVVKVGGVGNADGKRYIICFHHEDPIDGDIWVMIVGNNQAGFSLAFQKDKETVVDAEFKALPQDNEGTLIYYKEEEPAATVDVIQNLTNITSSFKGSSAALGSQLEAVLTEEEGFTIKAAAVKMGGEDITATAWSEAEKTVTIEEVTGAVAITAIAAE